MENLMVRESFLNSEGKDFEAREETEGIILHHTGTPDDDDLSAEEIDELHRALGWLGIGYHYVVREDGAIETGRPVWAVGAHAEGDNYGTLGIVLSGNFELSEPTQAQIESAAFLIAHLAQVYGIPLDGEHILGHRDVSATACPGKALYELIPTIIGKAIWYQAH